MYADVVGQAVDNASNTRDAATRSRPAGHVNQDTVRCATGSRKSRCTTRCGDTHGAASACRAGEGGTCSVLLPDVDGAESKLGRLKAQLPMPSRTSVAHALYTHGTQGRGMGSVGTFGVHGGHGSRT